jgi:hypothetical protein
LALGDEASIEQVGSKGDGRLVGHWRMVPGGMSK